MRLHTAFTPLRHLAGPIIVLFLLSAGGAAQTGVATARATAMEVAGAHYYNDEYVAAIAAYERAVRGGDGRAIEDSLSAYAYHRMGLSADYLGRPDSAIGYLRRAIALRDSLFIYPHGQQAKTRSILGGVLNRMGRLKAASEQLYAAAETYAALPATDSVNLLYTLVDLADVAAQQRDRQLTVDAATAAGQLLELNARLYDFQRAWFHYNLGIAVQRIREFDLAEHHARRALAENAALRDSELIAKANNLLHMVADGRGDRAAATRFLQTAIDAARPEDHVPLATYYFNLARLQELTGAFAAARESTRRATQLHPEDAATRAGIANVLGHLSAHAGDTAAARRHFNRAIAALSPATASEGGDLTQQPLDSLPDEQLYRLTEHLKDRADFLRQSNRPASALTEYRNALRARDLLRHRVSSDASRHYLSGDVRPLFDAAVATCHTLFRETDNDEYLWHALHLSDRARAYSLQAKLREDRRELPVRQAALERRIARLEALVAAGKESEQPLAAARLELDRLRQTSLRTVIPPPETFDRAALLAHLATARATLLQYHLAEQASYLFILDGAGKIRVSTLPPAAQLGQLAGSWRGVIRESAYRRKSLRAVALQDSLDAVFLTTGRRLAKLLLPPTTADGPLLIVTDGVLTLLPFAALPVRDHSGPVDYRELHYLQDDRAISYAYSLATFLYRDRHRRRQYATDLLALAPTFGSTLPALAHSKGEVERIGESIAHHETLTGPAATQLAYRERAAGARVLHLSTHGYADPAEPALSYVAFSPTGGETDGNSLLYYHEIATLPLHAELVVLSACETNLGKYAPGELSLSLASAFAAAGAASTITTLWRVDDRATGELMAELYRHLGRGQDRLTATAAAQRSLRGGGDYVHPFYWSGVMLTGATGPIAWRRGVPGWWLWLGGGLVFTAAGGWMILRSRGGNRAPAAPPQPTDGESNYLRGHE